MKHPELVDFQCWKLKVDLKTRKAVLTCDDGNGNIYFTQKYESTDFPLAEITLYIGPADETRYTIYLPSER